MKNDTRRPQSAPPPSRYTFGTVHWTADGPRTTSTAGGTVSADADLWLPDHGDREEQADRYSPPFGTRLRDRLNPRLRQF